MNQRVKIRGKWYVPAVMRVETERDDGRPDTLTMMYAGEVAELNPQDPSKNRFVVCLAPEEALKARETRDDR